MPIKKYLILRKAAEIEEIMRRMTMISDINAAFSGREDYIKKLRENYHKAIGDTILHQSLQQKADKDWKERLKKYKR